MASKRAKDFSVTQYKLPMRWVRRFLAREGIGKAKPLTNMELFHQLTHWFTHIESNISAHYPNTVFDISSLSKQWLTDMRFGKNAWPAFEDAMTGHTRRAQRHLVSLAKRLESTRPKQFKPNQLFGIMLPSSSASNVYRAAATVSLMRGNTKRATLLLQRAVDLSPNELKLRKWFIEWLEQSNQVMTEKSVCMKGLEIAEGKQKQLEEMESSATSNVSPSLDLKSDIHFDVRDNEVLANFFRTKITEIDATLNNH